MNPMKNPFTPTPLRNDPSRGMVKPECVEHNWQELETAFICKKCGETKRK